METYQAEQALALAKERQHHIAAAARQLETLLAMEENDNDTIRNDNAASLVGENYMSFLSQMR